MDSILWLGEWPKTVLIFAFINYRIIASYSGLTSTFDSSFLQLNWKRKEKKKAILDIEILGATKATSVLWLVNSEEVEAGYISKFLSRKLRKGQQQEVPDSPVRAVTAVLMRRTSLLLTEPLLCWPLRAGLLPASPVLTCQLPAIAVSLSINIYLLLLGQGF